VVDRQSTDVDTKSIRALNIKLQKDARIELSQLPIADGLTLCLKK
jgi:predicted O-methyltransferase YrrM